MGWEPTKAETQVTIGDRILIYGHPSYTLLPDNRLIIGKVLSLRDFNGDLLTDVRSDYTYIEVPWLAYVDGGLVKLCQPASTWARNGFARSAYDAKAWTVAVWRPGINYGDAYKRNVI